MSVVIRHLKLINIAIIQKLLFFAAVIFMSFTFYYVLTGAYAADHGAEDDDTEQKNRMIMFKLSFTLALLCLSASLCVFIYRILY